MALPTTPTPKFPEDLGLSEILDRYLALVEQQSKFQPNKLQYWSLEIQIRKNFLTTGVIPGGASIEEQMKYITFCENEEKFWSWKAKEVEKAQARAENIMAQYPELIKSRKRRGREEKKKISLVAPVQERILFSIFKYR